MGDRGVVLVGDKFLDFSELDGVMTISEFELMLDGMPDTESLLPKKIVIGQGIAEAHISYICRRLGTLGMHNVVIFDEPIRHRRAGRMLSHKHVPENVLITDPNHVGENLYRMVLTIDDQCEIMADHVTGYHVQGMVLMEAARQAFIATTTKFVLPQGFQSYFIINEFNTDFKRFTFPLSLDIEVHLTAHEPVRKERPSFTAAITFFQNGLEVTSVLVKFTVFEQSAIVVKEQSQAKAALDRWVDTYVSTPVATDNVVASRTVS